MARRQKVTFLLLAGLSLQSPLCVAVAQAKPAQEAKPAKPPRTPPPKPPVQQPVAPQGRGKGMLATPEGEKLFEKLLKMSPEDRDKALSNLPPARRQQIEQRIRNIQNKPPAAQARTLNQLERLASLPPERRNEVRRSIRDFNQMRGDRKVAIRQEMQRLAGMADDQRQARMSSEDFRSRYSPDEQQMIGDLVEVLPQR